MNEYVLRSVLNDTLFGNKLCESANDQNIADFFYERLLLEKLLVGEPVSVPELRKILNKKILNFEFIKLDGEIRPAKGTTMMKYVPKPDHPKGIRPSSPKVATFFDMDKKAWRSVSQRSKEIVLQYGFGEKKKPVFVVRDKEDSEEDTKVEEPETKIDNIEEPTDTKQTDVVDKVDNDDIKDVDAVSMPKVDAIEKDLDFGDDDSDFGDFGDEEEDSFFGDEEEDSGEIEDVKAVSKPQVDIVSPGPKYGWKIKDKHKPESKPDIRPIVRSSARAPKIDTPMPPHSRQDSEILFPKEVKTQHPNVRNTLPTKEPPLEIEPEDYEL